MNEHDLVSRIQMAWVQNRMTGFEISGVLSTNDLIDPGMVVKEFIVVSETDSKSRAP